MKRHCFLQNETNSSSLEAAATAAAAARVYIDPNRAQKMTDASGGGREREREGERKCARSSSDVFPVYKVSQLRRRRPVERCKKCSIIAFAYRKERGSTRQDETLQNDMLLHFAFLICLHS